MDRRHPRLHGPGNEAIFVEDGFVVDGLETKPRQLRDAALHFLRRKRAGRRDKGDAIAGLQPTQANHRYVAISAATSWCSSLPSTPRIASIRAVGPGRSPITKRCLTFFSRMNASSYRFDEIRPDSTARTMASSVRPCKSISPLHTSTASHPAAIAS